MKKILAILLVVIFVVSLTVGVVSAWNSHWHNHNICHSYSYGSSNCHTCAALMVIAVRKKSTVTMAVATTIPAFKLISNQQQVKSCTNCLDTWKYQNT